MAVVFVVLFATVAFANTNDAVGSFTNLLSGPTLHLGYNRDASEKNTLGDFMYFIPLISPEPVVVTSSSNAAQFARVLSFSRRDRGNSFKVTCEFEFTGAGSRRNMIDQTAHIHRRESQLKAGRPMQRILASIDLQGPGKGVIEVEGLMVGGKSVAASVRFAFNAHGQMSPVSITLEDIRYVDGKMVPTNEVVARVNSLFFAQKPGRPMMEVTVASVKPKGAPDSFWQNFKAGLKGGIANFFIPPLAVTSIGHDAVLEFGGALVAQSKVFTFPFATNIVTMRRQ